MRSFPMKSVLAASALVAAAAVAVPATASAQTGSVRPAGGEAVPGSYVVVFKPNAVTTTAVGDLTARFGGAATAVWEHALHGFALKGSAETAAKIAGDPRVAYVQQDAMIKIAATQTPTPSWGLDRIDQRNLPLDNSYTFTTTASNVNAYIIDTGIRTTHVDFGGRAVFAANFAGDGINTDCNGHGTHVAGTVGGANFGVAKGVRLFAVKVLDCNGSGTTTGVINGVNWVAQNAIHPAVANMSLGGSAFQPLDDAVTGAINSGVSFAIASGNSNADACGFSPARTPAALTVNASDINDNRASFSNFGACTDLFAPGVNITSDWNAADNATAVLSGTSMATPHVAGAVALFLSANPGASPAQVTNAILGAATPNVIINPGPGSPNRLLFTGTNAPPPPLATLFRFFNGFDHLSAPSSPGGNYRLEGPLGRMLTAQVAGSHPIFQCRIGADFFTSLAGNCEGQIVIGLTGFLYDSAPPGAVPLRRCRVAGNGEHFDSTTANCEGQIVEGILGFVV